MRSYFATTTQQENGSNLIIGELLKGTLKPDVNGKKRMLCFGKTVNSVYYEVLDL